jgi:hypothetical protein
MNTTSSKKLDCIRGMTGGSTPAGSTPVTSSQLATARRQVYGAVHFGKFAGAQNRIAHAIDALSGIVKRSKH